MLILHIRCVHFFVVCDIFTENFDNDSIPAKIAKRDDRGQARSPRCGELLLYYLYYSKSRRLPGISQRNLYTIHKGTHQPSYWSISVEPYESATVCCYSAIRCTGRSSVSGTWSRVQTILRCVSRPQARQAII